MGALDIATSSLASAFRLGAGGRVRGVGKRPDKLLEVYEFEACPFCRKVREALSMLDLDAMIYPCPKDGARFRPEVEKRGGKALFPFLVDANAGLVLYESDAIIRHLFATYGDGRVPASLALGPLTTLSSGLASAVRPSGGRSARPSTRPAKPLELWSFESCPFCRIARESLCSLELPYVLHNVARGSAKRAEFSGRAGKMQVPYLVDPNTQRAMFESADIVAYLTATYGAA